MREIRNKKMSSINHWTVDKMCLLSGGTSPSAAGGHSGALRGRRGQWDQSKANVSWNCVLMQVGRVPSQKWLFIATSRARHCLLKSFPPEFKKNDECWINLMSILVAGMYSSSGYILVRVSQVCNHLLIMM